jgi:hypothetical protein
VYLKLIEPWWKVLRSLALQGRRFETWDELCQAIRDATLTGMPIGILSCRAVDGAISLVGPVASASCPK